MKVKKTLALLLALAMAFSLFACAQQQGADDVKRAPVPVQGSYPQANSSYFTNIVPVGTSSVVIQVGTTDSTYQLIPFDNDPTGSSATPFQFKWATGS